MRVLTLMGSGETSPTMVKTHRQLLDRLRAERGHASAVLLDTPFGFQSNADELTARAQQYFTQSVNQELAVASFRAATEVGTTAHEQALGAIRGADYVFAGPGSPTYALRQWRSSLVPALLADKLAAGGPGGCVTFASAAALTLGAVTVPVYEIYKVGAEPAWEEGLDLVGAALGVQVAVIPHFNNAEGGTHDTRFCYLGEDRLRAMEAQLPEGTFVLGIDEHTGLVADLDVGTAAVVGIGGVTVRFPGGRCTVHPSGSVLGIDELTARRPAAGALADPAAGAPGPAGAEARAQPAPGSESPLLGVARQAEEAFDAALRGRDLEAAIQAVLDLEAELHVWANETFSSDEMDRARGSLRSMVVRLGEAARDGLRDPRDAVAPYVDALLDLRRSARADKRFADADAVRDHLLAIGVEVRDTAAGTEWSLPNE